MSLLKQKKPDQKLLMPSSEDQEMMVDTYYLQQQQQMVNKPTMPCSWDVSTEKQKQQMISDCAQSLQSEAKEDVHRSNSQLAYMVQEAEQNEIKLETIESCENLQAVAKGTLL